MSRRPAHIPRLPPHLRTLSDDELLDHLEVLADQLDAAHAEERRVLDERLAVFGKLRDRVTLAAMAARARITPMGVRYSLRAPDQRRPAK